MNPYEPIFKEVANGLLEDSTIKPNYSDRTMLDACIIFQSVFMDKLFDNQNYDKMSVEDRNLMATKAGEELRKLVHTYTGLDTYELAKI